MPWRREEKQPRRADEILDELDRVIRNAKPVPLTDQVRVDARTLQKLINELRQARENEATS
jgi:hypothetical protein